MNNYKKKELLKLLREYNREILGQRNVQLNSIQDVAELIQPKIKSLVSKINRLPMFTKSGIKNKKLAINNSEIVYYKGNDASLSENEHYDNVISFKITTKDDKLEDIYYYNLNEFYYTDFFKKNDSIVNEVTKLLGRMHTVIIAIVYSNWLLIGQKKQDHKFCLEYSSHNPSLTPFDDNYPQIYCYNDLDKLLNKAYRACNQIYNNFEKISDLYINYSNQLINLSKKDKEIIYILNDFITGQKYY